MEAILLASTPGNKYGTLSIYTLSKLGEGGIHDSQVSTILAEPKLFPFVDNG